ALLGLSEGGFFPAAVKAVAEWFPQRSRAFVTGLFNSGSNFGAMVCPLVVPLLAARWGWRGAFFLLGVVGFAWVILWIRLFPVARPDTLPQSSERTSFAWWDLLRYRQTWAYVAGTAASAPIWWFYIFWTPDFFSKRYGLDLGHSSLPLMSIFLVGSFG